MLIQVIIFLIGIALLYSCGVLFVRGSSDTARIFNIRPFIVGVVIIAFATSAPEFCVSLLASIKNSRSLAIGNIVGSCICNIGMALGLSALIRPIKVNLSILRREIPILLVATAALFLACLDLRISRLEAGLFLTGFFIFIYYCIRSAKREPSDSLPLPDKALSRIKPFAYLVIGLVGLLSGAYIAVNSAVILARHFGISELVIGLTVLAIGTSLPELVASIAASRQGEGEISIGNVIGSNLFNILGIIGVICLIRPIIIDKSVITLSLPLLIFYTLALAPIIKSGARIGRLEGGALLLSYLAYLFLLFKI